MRILPIPSEGKFFLLAVSLILATLFGRPSIQVPQSAKPIEITGARAEELRGSYQAVVEAEHARDLAKAVAEAKEQAWRAEYNGWVGTQYKIARELSVPQGWVLNTLKMRFEPPSKSPKTDPLKVPETPDKPLSKARN